MSQGQEGTSTLVRQKAIQEVLHLVDANRDVWAGKASQDRAFVWLIQQRHLERNRPDRAGPRDLHTAASLRQLMVNLVGHRGKTNGVKRINDLFSEGSAVFSTKFLGDIEFHRLEQDALYRMAPGGSGVSKSTSAPKEGASKTTKASSSAAMYPDHEKSLNKDTDDNMNGRSRLKASSDPSNRHPVRSRLEQGLSKKRSRFEQEQNDDRVVIEGSSSDLSELSSVIEPSPPSKRRRLSEPTSKELATLPHKGKTAGLKRKRISGSEDDDVTDMPAVAETSGPKKQKTSRTQSVVKPVSELASVVDGSVLPAAEQSTGSSNKRKRGDELLLDTGSGSDELANTTKKAKMGEMGEETASAGAVGTGGLQGAQTSEQRDTTNPDVVGNVGRLGSSKQPSGQRLPSTTGTAESAAELQGHRTGERKGPSCPDEMENSAFNKARPPKPDERPFKPVYGLAIGKHVVEPVKMPLNRGSMDTRVSVDIVEKGFDYLLESAIKQAALGYCKENAYDPDHEAVFEPFPSERLEDLYKTFFACNDWRDCYGKLREHIPKFKIRSFEAIKGLIGAFVYNEVFMKPLPWDIESRFAGAMGPDSKFFAAAMDDRGYEFDFFLKHAVWKQINDKEFQQTEVSPRAKKLADALAMIMTPHLEHLTQVPKHKDYPDPAWRRRLQHAVFQAMVLKQKIDAACPSDATFSYYWPVHNEPFDGPDMITDDSTPNPRNVVAALTPGVRLTVHSKDGDQTFNANRAFVIATDVADYPVATAIDGEEGT